MEYGPTAVREAGLMKRLSDLGKWLDFRSLRAGYTPVQSLIPSYPGTAQRQLCIWKAFPILPWIPHAA